MRIHTHVISSTYTEVFSDRPSKNQHSAATQRGQLVKKSPWSPIHSAVRCFRALRWLMNQHGSYIQPKPFLGSRDSSGCSYPGAPGCAPTASRDGPHVGAILGLYFMDWPQIWTQNTPMIKQRCLSGARARRSTSDALVFRWTWDPRDSACGRDAQQHHGGSRSILHGLAPDLDSDYSNDQATLPLRSARSEVDVQRAGVSMELGSTRLCMWPTSAICITVVLGCLGTYSLTFWLEAGIVEM